MNRMFDDPHASIAELADQCVMCGLCLPHCPTYALDGTEAESPRGRIQLARALADGTLTGELDAARLHLDHCLSCRQCERVCPSQVRFGELMVRTRALIGPAPQRPSRLLRLLSRPRLTQMIAVATRLARAPRWMPALLRRFGMARDSAMLAALRMLDTSRPPRPTPRTVAPSSTQHASARTRVALYPGCVASVKDRAALEAAASLLEAAGFDVHRLPARCCGAMDRHDGLSARAANAASATERAWREAGAIDTVLTVTPGCLDTLGHDLPQARVEDVLGFLARHADRLRFAPLRLRVALHVPCSRRNGPRDEADVQTLLKRIPGLELRVLPVSAGCCGAAGSHALTFPTRAERLRALTLAPLADLAVDCLLSSNIGCRLHLAAGDRALPTEHPLSLLARQLESA
ncbi:(Fe-S)-binding protein [Oleiagrimonas soli]|uniref:Glycolate oxidase iron-sulfur subunit n=1 Tax=Oleiagrimonas soli TaxID=1543381 RepID=A0A099CSZ0_9GAMM|nr:(Fe-S)-binding protein [Oleiagrimonas soli]KGI76899.1 hypothetical protein LF63_0113325 [Oleiagrimonas soli]MBB6185243.1 glycolate oxidase iron-sulfur subunit [Oleiagrimonas soli]